MTKYLYTLTTIFSRLAAYRVDLIFTLFNYLVNPTITLLVISLAQPTTDISFRKLATTLILTNFIYISVRSSSDDLLYELNRNGQINNFLAKPFSLYLYLFFMELGEKFVNLVIFIPLSLLALLMFSSSPLLPQILIFALLLPLSILLAFNLSYLTGLLSFWIDEFWPILNLKAVVMSLLGGLVIPFTLFPASLSRLIKFTPVPYIAVFPLESLRAPLDLSALAIALFWIITSFIAIKLLEKVAIAKYSFTAG